MKRALLIAAAVIAVLGMAYFVFARYLPNTRLTSPPPIPNPFVQSRAKLPRPAHVVIVIEENKSPSNIIGNDEAPYINSLASAGALFINSNGVAHPSQPNYLALFTGNVNWNGDVCPERGVAPTSPTLGGSLLRARLSFAGYSEDLPRPGFAGCTGGAVNYGFSQKHAPWVGFHDVPPTRSLPLDRLPGYDSLPTVAFIIPDLAHDMHSGSIGAADDWLRAHVGPIVSWSRDHDALVIITWDESDREFDNAIPTIFIGANVNPGRYGERIDHYRVLRTIEDMYGLRPIGNSANVDPITDCWRWISLQPHRR
ncbi:MAG TPA: alkaline phosphatase family protein [Candidatus Eremiobacteraceae bacterium]